MVARGALGSFRRDYNPRLHHRGGTVGSLFVDFVTDRLRVGNFELGLEDVSDARVHIVSLRVAGPERHLNLLYLSTNK